MTASGGAFVITAAISCSFLPPVPVAGMVAG